jgi:hypothetical protein
MFFPKKVVAVLKIKLGFSPYFKGSVSRTNTPPNKISRV